MVEDDRMVVGRNLNVRYGRCFDIGISNDHDFEISITRFSPIKVQYTQAPNNMLFRGGFLRRALVCYDDFIQKNLELDESQKAEIKRE